MQFFDLLIFKVTCRLKSEASKTYLSFLWWFIEPILYLGTFYFVFETLLRRGTEDFVAFLLCGLVPWGWFQKSVSNSAPAILNGKQLLNQVRIPIVLFPLEVLVQDLVKQSIVFLLLFMFLVVYGIEITFYWFAVVPIIVTQFALTTAVAFMSAAIVPIIPDMRFLIQTGLMLLMFGSGIFYHYSILLPEHQALFLLNPIAALIADYRNVLVNGMPPNWSKLLVMFIASCMVIYAVVHLFHKTPDIYTRMTAES